MSLEIQIVSDLHLEFYNKKLVYNFIKPSAPILALLGDTCCLGADDDFEIFKRFISEVLPQYEHIIIITGNHEYYYNSPGKNKGYTLDAIDLKLKAYCKATSSKLHFLNNTSIKLTVGKKNYLIVGSTLWSHIPEDQQERIQNVMSDYQYIYVQDPKTKRIRNITAKEVDAMFKKNIKYIKSQIIKATKTGSRVIVFTHHKPYADASYNPNTFDPAYMSDLSAIIKKPVVFWGYGHTHIKDDTIKSGVRLYSLPRGYPRQQTRFDKSAIVKI